jgi:hypothetical protein
MGIEQQYAIRGMVINDIEYKLGGLNSRHTTAEVIILKAAGACNNLSIHVGMVV